MRTEWMRQLRSIPKPERRAVMLCRKLIAGSTALLALAVGIVFAEEKDEKEEKVEAQNLPAAVMKTVEETARGAKIVEAELEEENGQKIYSIEVKSASGEESELEIGLRRGSAGQGTGIGDARGE
jgi:hypothetical protein